MEPFSLFKMSVILSGLAAMLVFSPACKAQSEIAPDHFDGADPWATMAHKVGPVKSHQMLASSQANHDRPKFRPSKPAHRIQSVIPTRREARAQKVKEQENHNQQRN